MTPGNNDEPKPTAAPMTEPCEADVKAFVERYANIERLTPFRKKQLLRAALGKDKPNPPADDECCGCSCSPCLKDLWREEVQVWQEARGITVVEEDLPSKGDALDW